MRISDWSSDVCSSDLAFRLTRSTTNIVPAWLVKPPRMPFETQPKTHPNRKRYLKCQTITPLSPAGALLDRISLIESSTVRLLQWASKCWSTRRLGSSKTRTRFRSEEHTSELQ